MTDSKARQRVLSPDDLTPLDRAFQVIGVFNPGATRVVDETMLLARVAERPLPDQPGFVGLPRVGPSGAVTIDWEPEAAFDLSDPRVVRSKHDGVARLTSLSHLRVFRRGVGESEPWSAGSVFVPESPAEEYGVEDPRITTIDGIHWITYVAVSRHGAATAIASTSDFVRFERHGIIFPPENKDVVLFPRKIAGQYVALHRPTTKTDFCRPEVWIARSPDLLHWGGHEPLFQGISGWESDRTGAGAPPIELDEGWLVIYHGCGSSERPGDVGAYCAGAVLLDRDDPTRVLRRSREPLLRPIADFERSGFVPNVVFPTAVIDRETGLTIYYGAADTAVGVVDTSRDAVLASLH
ncbi:glycoside hydrolase family 130 protein [Botrimarina hoheduenensis]|uniref:Beta-1,4-mannooligosaccharide phosphorylase n=1 Tax=Botrimarina hoheduenensis TaxID=2528000 RepID=A0A5C5VUW3_9BACT|nr:glycoside hydrolase family 130 protein [Botrimarina hoheduenensis]TWT41312.1 Beta-1,4-mannooligosaccharide phosphorylase [Botrimarina hoheduenensis]